MERLPASQRIELRGIDMALTRDFRKTILARVQREPRYREALFTEAINAYLAGDPATGKSILRDLVNATVGFTRSRSIDFPVAGSPARYALIASVKSASR